MRSAHVSRGAVRVTLLAVLAALLPLSLGTAGAQSPATVRAAESVSSVAAARRAPRWVPPVGVLLNDPTTKDARAILSRVIRATDLTPRGETIRIVVWNLDDRRIVDALVRAKRRGVKVQVVVSGVVDNPSYTRLKTILNRNRTDQSFAKQCRAGCRSSASIMHSKIFLFSRVNGARWTSMFGSSNLATPAGARQWNDMVTLRSKGLYDYFVKIFNEYAADKSLAKPYEVRTVANTRVTLFPVGNRNPVADELRRVQCTGATGGTGTRGRTKIRVAIAGWFDAYGAEIASQLRSLWDRGCDVKIVTTLSGRGVNKTLRARTGRGPVPIKNISVDRNEDGVPERYLHLKALAISGVYDGDTSASVVFTGSPNWSARAQKSDEVWVRMIERPGFVAQYVRKVNALYSSRDASSRRTTQQPGVATKQGQVFGPPGVFELE